MFINYLDSIWHIYVWYVCVGSAVYISVDQQEQPDDLREFLTFNWQRRWKSERKLWFSPETVIDPNIPKIVSYDFYQILENKSQFSEFQDLELQKWWTCLGNA
jgi:hypothetical protein